VNSEDYLHVAVGVIKNTEGQVLISLRHDAAHQGGLWEFPGGKVEAAESVEQALTRELKEELDLSIDQLSPLIQIKHQYSDLNVLLDVWTVTRFSGNPKGCEGQEIKWVKVDQLTDYSFPEANIPIITAARLPAEYAILNATDDRDLLKDLCFMLDNGIKLIQARIKSLSVTDITRFIEKAMPLCKAKGARLLINSAVDSSRSIKVDGIHLTSKGLLELKQRPVGFSWVAASCHNREELKYAERMGVDFVVLAPVLATKTHPDTDPLGWEAFTLLASEVNIPIFALGGMKKQILSTAQSNGAQGIAGITCFLSK